MTIVPQENFPAVLLCGHGSRSPQASAEFHTVVKKVQDELPDHDVTGAFLEFNQPSILKSLRALYQHGHRQIIVQPLTLYNAGHTQKDIPEILANFKKTHPDATLHYGGSLGLSDPIILAAAKSIEKVLPNIDPEDCKLLVVGRGSKDRSIADHTITLCQKLHNRFDFGDTRYCYAFESSPLLSNALKQAAHSHYHHVIILPFQLFSGRLLSDIYSEIDQYSDKYPDFTFHKAPQIGMQDPIIDAILQNISQTMTNADC